MALPFSLSAQDKIILKSGREINCKISKEDSLNVYFSMVQGMTNVETFIPKDQVSSMHYWSHNQNKLDVGLLRVEKGLIKDQDGNVYILSEKVSGSQQRSIYALKTITDEKLYAIVEQYNEKLKTSNGIFKVASFLAGLSGACIGTGLGLKSVTSTNPVEEEANNENGNKLIKYGAIGMAGTLAVFIPVAFGIGKSNQSFLKKNVTDVHNKSINNVPSASAKVGFGIYQVYNESVPTLKIAFTF